MRHRFQINTGCCYDRNKTLETGRASGQDGMSRQGHDEQCSREGGRAREVSRGSRGEQCELRASFVYLNGDVSQ